MMLCREFSPVLVDPSPVEWQWVTLRVTSSLERLFDLAEGLLDNQPYLGPLCRSRPAFGGSPCSRRVVRTPRRPCSCQSCDDSSGEETDKKTNLWWSFPRRHRERAMRRTNEVEGTASSTRKGEKGDCRRPDTTAAKNVSCTATGKGRCGSGSTAECGATATAKDVATTAGLSPPASRPWALRVPLGGTPEPQDLRVWAQDNVLTVQSHTRGEDGATFVRHVTSLPSHVAPDALTSCLSRDGILTVTCNRAPEHPCHVPVTIESAEEQGRGEGETQADREGSAPRDQQGTREVHGNHSNTSSDHEGNSSCDTVSRSMAEATDDPEDQPRISQRDS